MYVQLFLMWLMVSFFLIFRLLYQRHWDKQPSFLTNSSANCNVTWFLFLSLYSKINRRMSKPDGEFRSQCVKMDYTAKLTGAQTQETTITLAESSGVFLDNVLLNLIGCWQLFDLGRNQMWSMKYEGSE